VASSAPPIGNQQISEPGEPENEDSLPGTAIALEYQLGTSEIERFRAYLAHNYSSDNAKLLVELIASDPSLFALLYRLIPDTRENIRSVIIDEYLELIERLATFRPPAEAQIQSNSFREQLQAWVSRQSDKANSAGSTTELMSGPW